MMDEKMGGKKECPPELKAKLDVVKALKKMAMELLAKGAEDGEEAVVAEIDMKKVPAEDAMKMMAEEDMDEMPEQDDKEEKLDLIDEMIKKKKQMA